MKKSAIYAIILAPTFIASCYIAGPYLAAVRVKDAVLNRDTNTLSQMVDFPRVRDSLSIQFNQALANDPEIQNSPYAGFAAMIAQTVVQRALETYVTPEGLSRIVAERMPEQGASEFNGKTEFSWLTPQLFEVTRTAADDPTNSLTVVFEKDGLFDDWDVVYLRSPSFSTITN